VVRVRIFQNFSIPIFLSGKTALKVDFHIHAHVTSMTRWVTVRESKLRRMPYTTAASFYYFDNRLIEAN